MRKTTRYIRNLFVGAGHSDIANTPGGVRTKAAGFVLAFLHAQADEKNYEKNC